VIELFVSAVGLVDNHEKDRLAASAAHNAAVPSAADLACEWGEDRA
jgi:hypothetical protein